MAALSFTKLDDADFEQLRAYVYESCGITLDHSKHSLVVGRLQPVLTLSLIHISEPTRPY